MPTPGNLNDPYWGYAAPAITAGGLVPILQTGNGTVTFAQNTFLPSMDGATQWAEEFLGLIEELMDIPDEERTPAIDLILDEIEEKRQKAQQYLDIRNGTIEMLRRQ